MLCPLTQSSAYSFPQQAPYFYILIYDIYLYYIICLYIICYKHFSYFDRNGIVFPPKISSNSIQLKQSLPSFTWSSKISNSKPIKGQYTQNDGYHFCLNVELFATHSHLLKSISALSSGQIHCSCLLPEGSLLSHCQLDTTILWQDQLVQVFTFKEHHLCCSPPTSCNLAVKAYQKLILSAGEEICSQVEKLAKGKSSINNNIAMLIYRRELFSIFLKLSNNISGDNPKGRRLQQSGTLTQQKMIFSASI